MKKTVDPTPTPAEKDDKDSTTTPATKVDWSKEVETIKNASAKDTIVVKMDETGVVSKDAIAAIKGTQKKLVLDMGDGIKWVINGSDVSKVPAKDVNMSVTVDSKKIPEDVIKAAKIEKDAKKVVQISLAHEGEFDSNRFFQSTLERHMQESMLTFTITIQRQRLLRVRCL